MIAKQSALVALLLGAFLTLTAAANAGPSNLKAFCAKHKNYSGPGEPSEDQVPPAVRAAGANYWRCMGGKVMVCEGGASGRACMHTERVDARRRRDFNDFCRQNPGSDSIPNALTTGLASSWKCSGTRPMPDESFPVDRQGYLKGSWQPLP